MKHRSPVLFTALIPVLLLASAAALADDAPPPASGADARAWLDLQNSGSASAPTPRPMPGEVADRVYERYLKSFEHPLPERFEREDLGTGGSSGSGSGTP